MPPESFSTERLTFRRPTLDDAEWIFQSYASDPEVTRYLSWPLHRDISDTETFLRRCEAVWTDRTAYPWVLELKSTTTPIGMLEMRLRPPRADVGYVLARSHWGKGLMTEAVQHVKAWSLSQPEIHRFWAVCDVENVASRRVLEKCGLELEGILRNWESRPDSAGRACDCLCFAAVDQ